MWKFGNQRGNSSPLFYFFNFCIFSAAESCKAALASCTLTGTTLKDAIATACPDVGDCDPFSDTRNRSSCVIDLMNSTSYTFYQQYSNTIRVSSDDTATQDDLEDTWSWLYAADAGSGPGPNECTATPDADQKGMELNTFWVSPAY